MDTIKINPGVALTHQPAREELDLRLRQLVKQERSKGRSFLMDVQAAKLHPRVPAHV